MAYVTVDDRTVHYAGFWIRFVAVFIDGVILGIAQAILGYGLFRDNYFGPFDQFDMNAGMDPTISLISLAISLTYTVFMWTQFGATVGKMAVGVVIVRTDFGRITVGQAFGRYFAQFLSGFVFGLGFIWAGFDRRKQSWHDKLAGTYVIYRNG